MVEATAKTVDATSAPQGASSIAGPLNDSVAAAPVAMASVPGQQDAVQPTRDGAGAADVDRNMFPALEMVRRIPSCPSPRPLSPATRRAEEQHFGLGPREPHTLRPSMPPPPSPSSGKS